MDFTKDMAVKAPDFSGVDATYADFSGNAESLRHGMMMLWQTTFGDSEEFVRLVFDTYFDTAVKEAIVVDGKVAAMLLGIPYTFADANGNNLNAVYYCGLATEPQYRRRGWMRALMERGDVEAKKRGVAFAFLIPADLPLRDFYRCAGYSEGIRRVAKRYAAGHDFYHEFALSLHHEKVAEKMESLKKFQNIEIIEMRQFDQNVISELTAFIHSLRPYEGAALRHSARDIEAVLTDCILSGGYAVIARDPGNDKKIRAFATVETSREDPENELMIPRVMCDSTLHKMALLNAISLHNPEKSLLIYQPVEHGRIEGVYETEYIPDTTEYPGVDALEGEDKVMTEDEAAENYAMVRFLSVSEILKFTTDKSENFKYRNLVKQLQNEKITLQQLQDVMMERGKGSAAEILGLPRLLLNASLLLD